MQHSPPRHAHASPSPRRRRMPAHYDELPSFWNNELQVCGELEGAPGAWTGNQGGFSAAHCARACARPPAARGSAQQADSLRRPSRRAGALQDDDQRVMMMRRRADAARPSAGTPTRPQATAFFVPGTPLGSLSSFYTSRSLPCLASLPCACLCHGLCGCRHCPWRGSSTPGRLRHGLTALLPCPCGPHRPLPHPCFEPPACAVNVDHYPTLPSVQHQSNLGQTPGQHRRASLAVQPPYLIPGPLRACPLHFSNSP
jgi:hypothetical protein